MMRSQLRRWGPPLVAALVLAIALAALHRELRDLHASGRSSTSVERIPLRAALPGAPVHGALLPDADRLRLARRCATWAPRSRTGRRRSRPSSGYAFSQALGFPLVTGAPPRYRLYTSWGVEAPDIARIIAFYSSTFWLGFLTVGGVAFLVEPPALPRPLQRLRRHRRPLGALFLLVADRVPPVVVAGWSRAADPPLDARRHRRWARPSARSSSRPPTGWPPR